jgi:AGCS family alanine or glycine:cation symporter
MVHAAAKTREPVSQGLAASVEPFFDTIVVNSMTALVIVVTGAYRLEGLNDIQITSAAFGSVIWWFPYILAVCVLLFAFTTIVSWSYYMSRAWAYLLGYSRLSMNAYRVLFCLAIIPGGCDDGATGRGLYRQPCRPDYDPERYRPLPARAHDTA